MYIVVYREGAIAAHSAYEYLKDRLATHFSDLCQNTNSHCIDILDIRINFLHGDVNRMPMLEPNYYNVDDSYGGRYVRYRASHVNGKDISSLDDICVIVFRHIGTHKWKKELDEKFCAGFGIPKSFLNPVTDIAKEPKPVPKSYLTTYNPYMSKDWKRKFLEEYRKKDIWDVDVDSMYPAYYIPVRHHGESFYKWLLNEFYGKPKSPGLEAIRSKLATDLAEETTKKKREDGFNATHYILDEFHVPEEVYKKRGCEMDAMCNYLKSKVLNEEKEKNDMGLENDLMLTKGEATIKVNGHEYYVKVTELDQRYGEPTELSVQVVEPLCRRRKTQNRMSYYVPEITDVKFEDPATIVFWADGTKTVVRAQGEEFDPEKGLAMAISRKAMGNKREYYHVFLKWLKKFRKQGSKPQSTAEALYGREWEE